MDSFVLLSEIIDEEWNNLRVNFAKPWTVPWTVPPGERDDYEIHFIEKGEGTFFRGKNKTYVKLGDIVLLHSMEGCSFTPKSSSFRSVFVTFTFNNPFRNARISELNRVINEGRTIMKYLKDIRMEKAKRLLLYSTRSITEIAYNVGFSNSQYFSQIFTSEAKMNPRAYRKVYRTD